MSEELVLVTGVSGFIASHVAKMLLEDGYRVRGTVRSLANEAKVEPLKKLAPDAKHQMELVEADLTKEEGWDKAVEGCSVVLHLASPFPDMLTTSLSEEDIVKPAKDGTLVVLRAASNVQTIRRVVLTSSFAAVHGETTIDPEKTYNEEDWTDPESPELDAYTKSKVLAEKAAWDFVKELPEDQKKFELTVINPTFVMGPPLLEAHKSSTSVTYMSQIMTKAYPALPKFMFPICDVRDVAKAHIKAMTLPEAANNRHIISTDSYWMKDLALSAAKEFRQQGYSIPTCQLPNFVVWVAGFFSKNLKNNLVPRVGKTLKVDNKRMVETLGLEPTAFDSTIQDMVYSMVDLGILRKSKKYKQVGSRAEVPAANGEAEDEKKDEENKEEEKKELEPEDKEEKDTEEKKEGGEEEEKKKEGEEEKPTKKEEEKDDKEEVEAEK